MIADAPPAVREATSRARGLVAAHETNRASYAASRAQRVAAPYDAPMTDTRQQRPFTASQANAVAAALERRGWRAESRSSHSLAFVEVRDLAVRWTPLIATLRTAADVGAFLEGHPGHGLIGRHPRCTGAAPPDTRKAARPPAGESAPAGCQQTPVSATAENRRSLIACVLSAAAHATVCSARRSLTLWPTFTRISTLLANSTRPLPVWGAVG